MIKLDKGFIEYRGNSATLMSEVTICLREFLEVGVLTKKDLELVIDMATKPTDELKEEATLKMLEYMLATMGEDATRDMINGGEDK